jgi:hypothetical protein
MTCFEWTLALTKPTSTAGTNFLFAAPRPKARPLVAVVRSQGDAQKSGSCCSRLEAALAAVGFAVAWFFMGLVLVLRLCGDGGIAPSQYYEYGRRVLFSDFSENLFETCHVCGKGDTFSGLDADVWKATGAGIGN